MHATPSWYQGPVRLLIERLEHKDLAILAHALAARSNGGNPPATLATLGGEVAQLVELGLLPQRAQAFADAVADVLDPRDPPRAA